MMPAMIMAINGDVSNRVNELVIGYTQCNALYCSEGASVSAGCALTSLSTLARKVFEVTVP